MTQQGSRISQPRCTRSRTQSPNWSPQGRTAKFTTLLEAIAIIGSLKRPTSPTSALTWRTSRRPRSWTVSTSGQGSKLSIKTTPITSRQERSQRQSSWRTPSLHLITEPTPSTTREWLKNKDSVYNIQTTNISRRNCLTIPHRWKTRTTTRSTSDPRRHRSSWTSTRRRSRARMRSSYSLSRWERPPVESASSKIHQQTQRFSRQWRLEQRSITNRGSGGERPRARMLSLLLQVRDSTT